MDSIQLLDVFFLIGLCMFSTVWISGSFAPFHRALRLRLVLAGFLQWACLIPFYLYLKTGSDLGFLLFMILFGGGGLFGALCGRELIKITKVHTKPKYEVLISKKEKYLLRDYVLLYKIYGELTNSFIRVISPILSRKMIKNILDDVIAKMPHIFKGCKIAANETIDFSPIRSNLDSIPEEKRFSVLVNAFTLVNGTLIKTHEATTSKSMSNRTFETVVKDTMEGYSDIFFGLGIPLQMPSGILENEKAKSVACILFKDTLEPLLKLCSKNTVTVIKKYLQKLRGKQKIFNYLFPKPSKIVNLPKIYEWIDKIPSEQAMKGIVDSFSMLMKDCYSIIQMDISNKIASQLFSQSMERFGISVHKQDVVDAIPVDIKVPLVFKLAQGGAYLLKEEKPTKGYELLGNSISYGDRGLCITKLPPKKVRERYGLEKTPIIWITFEGVKYEKKINPMQLDKLLRAIFEFVTIPGKSVIFIDCFKEIGMVNGFEQVIKNLIEIKGLCKENSASLLLSINPIMFDEKQMQIIKKDFEEER